MKAEKVIEALKHFEDEWVEEQPEISQRCVETLIEAVRWLVTQWNATSFTDAEIDEVDDFCKAIAEEMDDES